MCSEACLLHTAAVHQPPAHRRPVARVRCRRMPGDAIPMRQGLSGRRLHQAQHRAAAARSHSIKQKVQGHPANSQLARCACPHVPLIDGQTSRARAPWPPSLPDMAAANWSSKMASEILLVRRSSLLADPAAGCRASAAGGLEGAGTAAACSAAPAWDVVVSAAWTSLLPALPAATPLPAGTPWCAAGCGAAGLCALAVPAASWKIAAAEEGSAEGCPIPVTGSTALSGSAAGREG